MSDKNTWETLSHINVNKHTSEVGRFTYLTWAWAWAIAKEACPDLTYEVINFEGKPYLYDDSLGYIVKTVVFVGDEVIPMHLPVLDGANKAQLKADYKYLDRYQKEKTCKGATMFDINTAIMRCLTKNLAMFGLGHYIYAGEDLPEPPKFDYSTIQASVDVIIKGIADNDLSTAQEAWHELTKEEMEAAWVAKTKGGCFTQAEKTVMQSTEFRTINQ